MPGENQTALTGRPLVRGLLIVLILLTVVAVACAAVLIWQASRPAAVPATFSPASISASVQDAKDKLDAFEKRAATLQALVSALLFVTAFYSAGLGVFTYFNAKTAAEDARRYAGEVEKIKSDIRRTFPIFGDLDVSLREVFDHLDKMFPVVDWSRGFYEKRNPRQRQEILFYEKAVALFEFLNMQDFREGAAQAYRGLGSFYGTKFQYEGSTNEDDYQRAAFYLDLAVAADKNIRTLNDRGALWMVEKKMDRYQARLCFDGSHLLDDKHQRALYNLAVIWFREGRAKSGDEAKKAFQESIENATEALPLKRWQEVEETPYQADIRYERACAYSRYAEIDAQKKDELLAKAEADLRSNDMAAAFKAKNEQLIKALRDDVQPAGDLYLVASTEPHASAVRALLALV